MYVNWFPGNVVIIEVEGRQLHLAREEAEQLFVDLGRTLQDMDVHRYEENGETQPQP